MSESGRSARFSGARNIGKTALRKAFERGQHLGFDILPRHFYSSIPDIRALRATTDWRMPRSLLGVRGAALPDQLEQFRHCFSDSVREKLREINIYDEACRANGAKGYGPIEAEILYAFIATHRPSRVVQVGAGVSTAVILSAIHDFDLDVEVLCIDPFPTDYLVGAAKRNQITLYNESAQTAGLGMLTGFANGGLLFVDSTHTVKPGSEVNLIILEAITRLPAGTFMHFHDITLPYDYSPHILDDGLFFWDETALLLAFLIGNCRTEVLFSASMLHHAHPEAIFEQLPRYRPMRSEMGISVQAGHYPTAAYLVVSPGAKLTESAPR